MTGKEPSRVILCNSFPDYLQGSAKLKKYLNKYQLVMIKIQLALLNLGAEAKETVKFRTPKFIDPNSESCDFR